MSEVPHTEDVAIDDETPSFEDIFNAHVREYGGAVEDAEVEDEDPEVLDEDSDEEVEDADDEDSATHKPKTRGSKPGTDEILKHLDEFWPEASEIVRGMQGRMHTAINDSNEATSLRDELVSELRAVQGLKAQYEAQLNGSKTTDSDEDMPKEEQPVYTEAQLELVRAIARDQGWVSKDDLEAERQAEQYETELEKSLEEGFELYGEEFGTRDESGKIQLNPKLAKAIDSLSKEIDEKGLTPLQLASLAGLGTAQPQKSTPEAPAGGDGATRSAKALQRAGTVTRSAGGTQMSGRPTIEIEGRTAEEVLDDAWALGKRRLFAKRGGR